jgi:hypothetical protein
VAIVFALEQLYSQVSSQFAIELGPDSKPVPNLFGWRTSRQQLVNGQRIVWYPGDPSGALGDIANAKYPGRIDPGRPLATLAELFTVELSSVDASDNENEAHQYHNVRLLYDAWYRICYKYAHGTFKVKSSSWINTKLERRFGAAIRAICTVEAMIPDVPFVGILTNTSGDFNVYELDVVEKLIIQYGGIQASLIGNGLGVLSFAGIAQGAQPGLAGAASGVEVLQGSAAGVQPGMVGAVAGTVDFTGIGAGAQPGLTAAVVAQPLSFKGIGAGAQPGLTAAAKSPDLVIASYSPFRWWDANVGISSTGALVDSWTDRVAGEVVSAAGAARPTLVPVAAPWGGRQVLSVAGAQYLDSNPSAGAAHYSGAAGTLTTYQVARRSAPSSSLVDLFSLGPTSGGTFQWTQSLRGLNIPALDVSVGSYSSGLAVGQTPFLLVTIYKADGTVYKQYVNGVQGQVLGAITAMPTSLGQLCIFARLYGGSPNIPWVGDGAEFLVFDGMHDDTARMAIEAALSAKWGGFSKPSYIATGAGAQAGLTAAAPGALKLQGAGAGAQAGLVGAALSQPLSFRGAGAGAQPGLVGAAAAPASSTLTYAAKAWVRPAGVAKLPLVLRNPQNDNAKYDYLKDGPSAVLKFGPGDFRMYFEALTDQHGSDTNFWFYATSPDGYTWTKDATQPAESPTEVWENGEVCPDNWFWDPDASHFKMYYHGGNNVPHRSIGLMTSDTGLPGSWTRENSSLPVLTYGTSGAWDDFFIADAWVSRVGVGDYRMVYKGCRSSDSKSQIGYATSPDGISWTKYASNPILNFGVSGNDSVELIGSSFYVDELGRIHLWYVGRDSGSVARVMYAYSDNWVSWTRNSALSVASKSTTGSQPDGGDIGDVIRYWVDDGLLFFTMMNFNASSYSGDALGRLEGRGLYWLPKAAATQPARPGRCYRPIIGSGRAFSSVPVTSKLLNQTTFSLWLDFKIPPGNTYRYLYLEYAAFNKQVKVALSTAGIIDGWYRTATAIAAFSSTARFDDNQWHRMLIRRTGASAFSVFVDGVQVSTATTSPGTDATTLTEISIGGVTPGNTTAAPITEAHGAAGLIRRIVSIAGYAMTDAEELTLWNSGTAGGLAPTSGTKLLDLLLGSGGGAGPDVSGAISCTSTNTEMVDAAYSQDVPA